VTLYTVYRTTNRINGKYYIGYHETSVPNDAYLGSGLRLVGAVAKYGRSNFVKEVLFVFDTKQAMLDKERELITEEVLNDPQCYNLCEGGIGCDSKYRKLGGHNSQLLPSVQHRVRHVLHKLGTAACARIGHKPPPFTGQRHAQASIDKLSNAMKGRYTGQKNPQFGKRWIHCSNEEKMIPKLHILPRGWFPGRLVKSQAL